MIEFKATADPHSLDLLRDGRRVGSLHWHPNSCPGGRVVLWAGPGAHNELTVDECEQVARRYHEERLRQAGERERQAALALRCDTCEQQPEQAALPGGHVLTHGDHCQQVERSGCRERRCPGTLLRA